MILSAYKLMSNISYFILIFLFTFGPVFNRFGPWFDTIFITAVSVIGIHLLAQKHELLPEYFNVFFILLPTALFSLITALLYSSVVTNGQIISFILSPLRVIVTMLAAYYLGINFYQKYQKDSLKVILNFIYWSVIIHAAVMIFQFYNIGFRDFVYSYTTTGEFRGSFVYNFRMGGLSGATGGAILSVMQSMGLILLPFVIKLNNRKTNIVHLLLSPIILFSILICGRSGLWATIIFLPFSVVFAYKINFKLISKLVLFSIILIISILMFVTVFVNKDNSDPVQLAFGRTLDTFSNLSTSGEFEDNSINTLLDMFIIPDDANIFIWGNGDYVINRSFGRRLDSDIGYIRSLWGYGIIGSIMFYLPFAFITAISLKCFNNHLSARIVLIVSIVIGVFQFKENFMYARMLLSIWGILIGVFYINVSGKYKYQVS